MLWLVPFHMRDGTKAVGADIKAAFSPVRALSTGLISRRIRFYHAQTFSLLISHSVKPEVERSGF